MIDTFLEWLDNSENIVFFGGAGVSTESGIPDFRSSEGLYNETPEYILSKTYFDENPDKFYEFYKKNLVHRGAEPNITHKILAKLEEMGKLKAVITQNIDGLHQKAGSENVIELHGGIEENYCIKCGKGYDLDYVMESRGIPMCKCGGIVRPKVTLYEESLDMTSIERAIKYIKEADVLIVGGTSLIVQPAASLIDYYRGEKLILINKGVTTYNKRANLVFEEGLGKVFSEIMV